MLRTLPRGSCSRAAAASTASATARSLAPCAETLWAAAMRATVEPETSSPPLRATTPEGRAELIGGDGGALELQLRASSASPQRRLMHPQPWDAACPSPL